MLLYPLAPLRLHGLLIKHSNDAVGAAHRRDFGVSDDDSLVRIAHRKGRTPLDARRTVAENPVKVGSQVGDNPPGPLVRQGVLVPGLGRGKQPQILQPLIANESLRELCHALHHVDEVEHNPAFRPHTNRRSAPITRSRLRRPTSKSMTATFSPICASAAPSAAVEVVFPTPPFPDVTTKTFAIIFLLCRLIQRCNFHDVAFEPRLSS